jgi:hypothetical protein
MLSRGDRRVTKRRALQYLSYMGDDLLKGHDWLPRLAGTCDQKMTETILQIVGLPAERKR